MSLHAKDDCVQKGSSRSHCTLAWCPNHLWEAGGPMVHPPPPTPSRPSHASRPSRGQRSRHLHVLPHRVAALPCGRCLLLLHRRCSGRDDGGAEAGNVGRDRVTLEYVERVTQADDGHGGRGGLELLVSLQAAVQGLDGLADELLARNCVGGRGGRGVRGKASERRGECTVARAASQRRQWGRTHGPRTSRNCAPGTSWPTGSSTRSPWTSTRSSCPRGTFGRGVVRSGHSPRRGGRRRTASARRTASRAGACRRSV